MIRILGLPLLACLAATTLAAQDNPKREFLRPVEAQKLDELMERHALDIRTMEFFAKPGKLALYEYDMDVLEVGGETVTITPFGGPAIELLSAGIWRDPGKNGRAANWRGSLPSKSSDGSYRARLNLIIRSVDSEGNLHRPDPGLQPLKAKLTNGGRSDPEHLLLPREQRLGYVFTGNSIRNPDTGSRIKFFSFRRDLDVVLVYEVDEDKVILPGDDSPVNRMEPSQEQVLLRKAFNEHVQKVRLELGLPAGPE